MSAAKPGQGRSGGTVDPTHPDEAQGALPLKAHPGITVNGWTLRWAGDCWSVGRWVTHGGRRRWRYATWYGRLDHALTELLDRSVQGEISDLPDLVERVERAFERISTLVHHAHR